MKTAVLLDTGFLISLVDQKRPHHGVAAQYYRAMLEQQVPMYFSAIVAAEFAIKQPITDLPLHHSRSIPFNILHAQEAGHWWNALGKRDEGDARHIVRDDVKLIAQACRVAERAVPFDAEELERIRRWIGENMNEACTGCGYCAGCPQNIPTAAYMLYYNEKHLFGRGDEEMIGNLNFQHNFGLLAGRQAQAGECIECGQCEEACTQRLPIIRRLGEIAGWERIADGA